MISTSKKIQNNPQNIIGTKFAKQNAETTKGVAK